MDENQRMGIESVQIVRTKPPQYLVPRLLVFFFLNEKEEGKPLCGIKVPAPKEKKIRSRFDFLPILIELVTPLRPCEIAY